MHVQRNFGAKYFSPVKMENPAGKGPILKTPQQRPDSEVTKGGSCRVGRKETEDRERSTKKREREIVYAFVCERDTHTK